MTSRAGNNGQVPRIESTPHDGVYAHSPDKVGKDAADLCGWPEHTGIVATDDVASLLALQPDACCYNPLWPSIDELEALVQAHSYRERFGPNTVPVPARPAAE